MQTLDIPYIEGITKEFLEHPQVECPVTHNFAPDIYIREIFMPADTVVIGHKHLTEHFNVILKGKCRVMIGDVVEELTAPCTFVSGAGSQDRERPRGLHLANRPFKPRQRERH